MERTFLLFSGHNDRAVIALCRYFSVAGLDFSIIASGRDDFIHRTAYRDRVILERSDRGINVALFRKVLATQEKLFLYCPTTEFINSYLLDHAVDLDGLNIEVGLPDAEVYRRVTGKKSSQILVDDLRGLKIPEDFPLSMVTAPCVLKPLVNLAAGEILYPWLCQTSGDLAHALSVIDTSLYFAQEYIDGQSYYLCGYIDRSGRHCSYWQKNLLQQANGKSIVLAVEHANPGFDENAFFSRLQSVGYHGPVMMEVIAHEGDFYYIEINPRFWGPLQLGLDACPGMLDLFVRDHGCHPASTLSRSRSAPAYYSWKAGALQGGLRKYGAESLAGLEELLTVHDVFAHPDCQPANQR